MARHRNIELAVVAVGIPEPAAFADSSQEPVDKLVLVGVVEQAEQRVMIPELERSSLWGTVGSVVHSDKRWSPVEADCQGHCRLMES